MKIDKYMQENPYPDIPEFESSEKPKTNKVIYVLIGLALLIVFVSVLFFISARESVCGNGICEVDENCFDCPKDCECVDDEYCSAEEKICVVSTCGDGRCRFGECSLGCTVDCGISDCCGNGDCDTAIGETCNTCSVDCGVCPVTPVCGNKVCESGENCYDCSRDCKCVDGEYCSPEEKICVMPTCGDGRCGPYENSMNCCLDCDCELRGEVCNTVTHKCEMPDVALTDKRIEEWVVNHYNTQGKNVDDLEIQEVFVWENKVGRKVGVKIPDQKWLSFVLVTEDEEVIELPFI